jgi:ABC-2 type transport system permease protein
MTILSLVRFEAVALARRRGALMPLLILGVLVLLAFGARAIDTARAETERATISQAERARWLALPPQDAHGAAHWGIYAFKPAPALLPLDPGISDDVGQSVWLEAHRQDDMLYRPRQEASPLRRAAAVDPSGLIVAFGPLALFLLAFTTVADTRERGILALALPNSREPTRLLRAKALAITLAAILVLVVPLTLTAPILAAASGRLTGDILMRVVLWTAVMSIFLAVLAMVGVTLAAAWHDPRRALEALFALWVLLSFVAPRLAIAGANRVDPLPSTAAVRQEMLDEAPAYWSPESSAEHKRTVLARYGVKRAEDLPIGARGAELDLAERRSHRVFDRVLGGLYTAIERQERDYAAFGLLSPAVAATALSATVAGTDFPQHRAFITSAEQYRRNLVNTMNDAVMHHIHNHSGMAPPDDVNLWSRVPAFHYDPPLLPLGLERAWPALVALLLWAVVAALALRAVARRLTA